MHKQQLILILFFSSDLVLSLQLRFPFVSSSSLFQAADPEVKASVACGRRILWRGRLRWESPLLLVAAAVGLTAGGELFWCWWRRKVRECLGWSEDRDGCEVMWVGSVGWRKNDWEGKICGNGAASGVGAWRLCLGGVWLGKRGMVRCERRGMAVGEISLGVVFGWLV